MQTQSQNTTISLLAEKIKRIRNEQASLDLSHSPSLSTKDLEEDLELIYDVPLILYSPEVALIPTIAPCQIMHGNKRPLKELSCMNVDACLPCRKQKHPNNLNAALIDVVKA